MPRATLTSKGQLTVPKEIRNLLKLDTGASVDFIIGSHGKVVIQPALTDISALKGMLKKPRSPVPVEEMDRAVLEQMKKKGW